MKLCLLFFPFFLISCQGHVQTEKSPAEYVNPFIDTHKSRWFFFSSASRPFGMVNLSPDTNVAHGNQDICLIVHMSVVSVMCMLGNCRVYL